jgi:hypothetical protein
MRHGHNSHAMCAAVFFRIFAFFSIFKSERNPGVARHY